MARYIFNIPDYQREALTVLSETTQLPMSALVREALDVFLQSRLLNEVCVSGRMSAIALVRVRASGIAC